jgi:hypothetical protein
VLFFAQNGPVAPDYALVYDVATNRNLRSFSKTRPTLTSKLATFIKLIKMYHGSMKLR